MSYTFHTTGNMSFQWELDRKQKNKKQKKQANAWMEPNYYGENECNEFMENYWSSHSLQHTSIRLQNYAMLTTKFTHRLKIILLHYL